MSVVSNLPADTELLSINIDLTANQVTAVVRSDGFEDTEDFLPIPEFKVTYAPAASHVTAAPAPAKAEPAKSIPAKAVSAPVSAAPKTSQSALKLEGEFSPDQRKLLSFKVEGDYVIVKPTTFLKEEWEDINEVVRSLGGKWVKGDIISFWQIPVQQNQA